MIKKEKINVTIDSELKKYITTFAKEQRITVSDIFRGFILNLKQIKEKNTPEVILCSDPDFNKSLKDTVSILKTCRVKPHGYEEVFDINENEWRRCAAANPVFDFLKEPEEEIYTLDDGKPFNN
ncbi:MAG: hypothetical protein HQK88_08300 [Nitrospirae bacterium]|nr:hypothetical protein [Nitrospirota bacterium]MBF0534887.1 hypothetical protein [Nitrospirota bacterium]MBF0616802.1 hypothetical protein [Nitrospirota bacterium]